MIMLIRELMESSEFFILEIASSSLVVCDSERHVYDNLLSNRGTKIWFVVESRELPDTILADTRISDTVNSQAQSKKVCGERV